MRAGAGVSAPWGTRSKRLTLQPKVSSTIDAIKSASPTSASLAAQLTKPNPHRLSGLAKSAVPQVTPARSLPQDKQDSATSKNVNTAIASSSKPAPAPQQSFTSTAQPDGAKIPQGPRQKIKSFVPLLPAKGKVQTKKTKAGGKSEGKKQKDVVVYAPPPSKIMEEAEEGERDAKGVWVPALSQVVRGNDEPSDRETECAGNPVDERKIQAGGDMVGEVVEGQARTASVGPDHNNGEAAPTPHLSTEHDRQPESTSIKRRGNRSIRSRAGSHNKFSHAAAAENGEIADSSSPHLAVQHTASRIAPDRKEEPLFLPSEDEEADERIPDPIPRPNTRRSERQSSSHHSSSLVRQTPPSSPCPRVSITASHDARALQRQSRFRPDQHGLTARGASAPSGSEGLDEERVDDVTGQRARGALGPHSASSDASQHESDAEDEDDAHPGRRAIKTPRMYGDRSKRHIPAAPASRKEGVASKTAKQRSRRAIANAPEKTKRRQREVDAGAAPRVKRVRMDIQSVDGVSAIAGAGTRRRWNVVESASEPEGNDACEESNGPDDHRHSSARASRTSGQKRNKIHSLPQLSRKGDLPADAEDQQAVEGLLGAEDSRTASRRSTGGQDLTASSARDSARMSKSEKRAILDRDPLAATVRRAGTQPVVPLSSDSEPEEAIGDEEAGIQKLDSGYPALGAQVDIDSELEVYLDARPAHTDRATTYVPPDDAYSVEGVEDHEDDYLDNFASTLPQSLHPRKVLRGHRRGVRTGDPEEDALSAPRKKKKKRTRYPTRHDYTRDSLSDVPSRSPARARLIRTIPFSDLRDPLPPTDFDDDVEDGPDGQGVRYIRPRRREREWDLNMFNPRTPPPRQMAPGLHALSDHVDPVTKAQENEWGDRELLAMREMRSEDSMRSKFRRARHHPYESSDARLKLSRSSDARARADEWTANVHARAKSTRYMSTSRRRRQPRPFDLPGYILPPIKTISYAAYCDRYAAECATKRETGVTDFPVDPTLVKRGVAQMREQHQQNVDRARASRQRARENAQKRMQSIMWEMDGTQGTTHDRIDTNSPSQQAVPDIGSSTGRGGALMQQGMARGHLLPKLCFTARSPSPPTSNQKRKRPVMRLGAPEMMAGEEPLDGWGAAEDSGGHLPLPEEIARGATRSVKNAMRGKSVSALVMAPRKENEGGEDGFDTLFGSAPAAVPHVDTAQPADGPAALQAAETAHDPIEDMPFPENVDPPYAPQTSAPQTPRVHPADASKTPAPTESRMLNGVRLTDTLLQQLERARELCNELEKDRFVQPDQSCGGSTVKSPVKRGGATRGRPRTRGGVPERRMSQSKLDVWVDKVNPGGAGFPETGFPPREHPELRARLGERREFQAESTPTAGKQPRVTSPDFDEWEATETDDVELHTFAPRATQMPPVDSISQHIQTRQDQMNIYSSSPHIGTVTAPTTPDWGRQANHRIDRTALSSSSALGPTTPGPTQRRPPVTPSAAPRIGVARAGRVQELAGRADPRPTSPGQDLDGASRTLARARLRATPVTPLAARRQPSGARNTPGTPGAQAQRLAFAPSTPRRIGISRAGTIALPVAGQRSPAPHSPTQVPTQISRGVRTAVSRFRSRVAQSGSSGIGGIVGVGGGDESGAFSSTQRDSAPMQSEDGDEGGEEMGCASVRQGWGLGAGLTGLTGTETLPRATVHHGLAGAQSMRRPGRNLVPLAAQPSRTVAPAVLTLGTPGRAMGPTALTSGPASRTIGLSGMAHGIYDANPSPAHARGPVIERRTRRGPARVVLRPAASTTGLEPGTSRGGGGGQGQGLGGGPQRGFDGGVRSETTFGRRVGVQAGGDGADLGGSKGGLTRSMGRTHSARAMAPFKTLTLPRAEL